ncbi:unnamed protein product [Clonostachys solani]|uniref:Uncharacterized protein n=1 Tax=Clonostachys solani TaxID=160281 RepID=A0A9N9ZF24_9HYPO|nr:unnamed protein product [Clonostachys solani]
MDQGANSHSSPRPGGRPASKLVVKEEGRRPLFSTGNVSQAESIVKNTEKKPTQPKDGARASTTPRSAARRTNSESLISRAGNSLPPPSPSSTRIPRPGSVGGSGGLSNRRPITLSEAFRLAEEEEVHTGKPGNDDMRAQPIDGSPSPAPRPWRASRDFDNTRLRSLLEHDHLDTKGANRQIKSNEQAKNNKAPAARPSKGPSSANTGTNGGGISLPDLVPGIEDLPLPSVEPAENVPAPASPEKSFAWQVDEDFTAGDLQVSDSPRLKTDRRPFENRLPFDENSLVDINSRTRVNNPGSKNTRLDEIRSREVKTGNHLPIGPRSLKSTNTKIDEIIAREAEVESQIPIPDRRLSSASKNTKLDEIRQRELDGLSKRRLAAARLEEIREKNSMSRQKSSEETRSQSDQQSDGPSSVDGSETKPDASEKRRAGTKDSPPKDTYGGGERIPDTPVTVYKSRPERAGDQVQNKGDQANQQSDTKKAAKSTPLSRRRADSKDLLSRLARATSSSPLLNTETKKAPSHRASDKVSTSAGPSTTGRSSRTLLGAVAGRRKKASNDGESKPSERPTVEFAGLRRVRSTESSGSKRFSTHSETDPTDRIEAEMKLFAPHDNHSERGSVRAPSPASSDGHIIKKEVVGDEEMTPRKNNADPLTMPTPRVTGAYVETPATVKVEKIQDPVPPQEVALPQADREQAKEAGRVGRALGTHTAGIRRQARDTSSDPGVGESEGRTRARSTSVTQKRARSLSRSRPPLKNSAKPPSVYDDIIELLRTQKLDDSTLDELEAVINQPLGILERMSLVDDLPAPKDSQDDDSFELKMETYLADMEKKGLTEDLKNEKVDEEVDEGELAAYDRMSRSLQTGLQGIRTAKKGIERLEDSLRDGERFYAESQAKLAAVEEAEKHRSKHQEQDHRQEQGHQQELDEKHADSSSVGYVKLPVPRLYTLRPRFQLTILGLFAMLLSLWSVAETGMCAKYCIPVSCSTTPCVWSYDDPTFGKALPIKLDQWATGGVGRVAFGNARQTVEDWLADVTDSVYGRDIKDIDISKLSFEGRRAHRRRLRNKGLLNDEARQVEKAATPEIRERWASWRRERINREKAREARSMGYDQDEDDSMGGDQRIG